MRRFTMLVACAATLAAGSAVTAKEKPDQSREKKICRTVEVSGRVTPQKICRKAVLRPAAEKESQPSARESGESTKSGD